MSCAQYVDHPEDFTFRLPDNITHEEGAMVEPLSVGVQAVRKAGICPGKSVAIMGAGPIGA
jgi:L-iditol 2-dehydrogenase